MKNLLSKWFNNILAFDEIGPIKKEFSIIDPTAAQPNGLSTVILAISPADGNSPTIASLYFDSGVKLFEKKYSDDQDAQTEMQAMANDLQEVSTLSKENKVDEAKNLMSSLIEKYKRVSDTLVQPSPVTTNTQASQEPLQYKGFLLKKLSDGSWQASQDELAFTADSIDAVKAKVDNMLRKAYGKKLAKSAGIILQNVFFDTPDEAMEYQEKMKKLQGPEADSGQPLWEQMGNEEVAPSNETSSEEDNELAPPSLSFDRIEKDKAKSDKDIGKRIKEQVKTEVESALEQKSASVFGPDQEDLVEALRKNGRNWDEIKKIFVKELSYNEDDTTVFLDSIRQKEEGGEPAEGLPFPPKPPEDLVSPETHNKLVKEIDDKTEPKLDLKPEPKPLENEIARADNAEIRKIATTVCEECGFTNGEHSEKCYHSDCDEDDYNVHGCGPIKTATKKVALNPLQEPPAIGQAPGQPLAAPVEENPTFDSPVPPSQDSNPEPEYLEAPQSGDRVYVMGDYETGQDGFEGTMVSEYTSKGDEYAVVSKDNGENAEVALHRVVRASQKKVAKAYYEKKAKHEHVFEKKPSGIEICPCGRFRFPEEYLKTHPPIVEQREEKEANLGKKADTTTDLSQFGNRERGMARELLNAWHEQGLPEDFNADAVTIMMNTNSGNVFLTNSDYQVAMMHGGRLESWYNCPYCGNEGFKDGMLHEPQNKECTRYMQEIGVLPQPQQPEGPDELQSLHESALKLQAELEREGEIAIYFHKEGLEKQASGDSAFEGNGWCRVWVDDLEIQSDAKYPEVLKLPEENARIAALKELAREIAHEALRDADTAAGKFGVQAWFESLEPSRHDRIDWVALANPQPENVESSQESKVEKKAALPIPKDYPVQPLKPGEPAKDPVTCGTCGLTWDDAKITSMTPAPAARCPFEYFHEYDTKAALKEAADPIPPAEGPKEVPTQFKNLEKAPAHTDREKAQPATEEQAKLVQEMQSSLSSLEAIKSMIAQAKVKLNEEIKNIEQKGGRVQIEAELKERMERLAKLIEATENQMINAGDTVVRLVQENKEKPFKPSDAWKVQKLVEKFAGAQEYLDKAIAGAQSLATTEQVRDLVFFPRKSSQSMRLSKKATFMDTLDDVYNDVLAALKLIIGSDEQSAVV